jgi:hypothetical protein
MRYADTRIGHQVFMNEPPSPLIGTGISFLRLSPSGSGTGNQSANARPDINQACDVVDDATNRHAIDAIDPRFVVSEV